MKKAKGTSYHYTTVNGLCGIIENMYWFSVNRNFWFQS